MFLYFCRYHSLAPMYYRGAQAAIVVYDIQNQDSFQRAKTWVKELQRQVNYIWTKKKQKLPVIITINLLCTCTTQIYLWIKLISFFFKKKASPNIVIALAGNKADLTNSRVVEYEEAKQYAEENGLLFMETSAKTAMNVNDIFLAIGECFNPLNPYPYFQYYVMLGCVVVYTYTCRNHNNRFPATYKEEPSRRLIPGCDEQIFMSRPACLWVCW